MSLLEPSTIIFLATLPNQTYVAVSALEGGHLTLLKSLFVTGAEPEKRNTVPSLSFHIQHASTTANGKISKDVFDLGLKRDFRGYRDAQQHHIAQRQATTVTLDIADSLRKGDLEPNEINTVILSHVH